MLSQDHRFVKFTTFSMPLIGLRKYLDWTKFSLSYKILQYLVNGYMICDIFTREYSLFKLAVNVFGGL